MTHEPDKDKPRSATDPSQGFSALPLQPNREPSAKRVGGSSTPLPLGRLSFRRVLNATGIILDPKLGGPPLPVVAQRLVADVGAGYSTLGSDPSLGTPGPLESGIEHWLRRLTGAPSAFAVNSSTGAILLVLSSIAAERKVLVSRAELTEGSRALSLSDIVTKSRARFVEVGATHKTRVADFEKAFEKYSSVAAILRIPSPAVVIEGLSKDSGPSELAKLARAHDVPLIEDLGNGSVVDLSMYGLERRPTVADSLASGASVVTCSGSLLLTGSQVGLILGEARWIEGMRGDALVRAVRLDRLVHAALEATLAVHCDPGRVADEIPALAMLSLPERLLRERADRLAAELQSRVAGLKAWVVDGETVAHRHSGLPTARLPGPMVELTHQTLNVAEIDQLARSGDPPVLGVLHKGRFLLDPRTLNEREVALAATSIASVWDAGKRRAA